jgi:hypothetical protein
MSQIPDETQTIPVEEKPWEKEGEELEREMAEEEIVNGKHYLVPADMAWDMEPERVYDLLRDPLYYRNQHVDPDDPFNPLKNTIRAGYNQYPMQTVQDDGTTATVTICQLFIKSRRDMSRSPRTTFRWAPGVIHKGETGCYGNYEQLLVEAAIKEDDPDRKRKLVKLMLKAYFNFEMRNAAPHPNARVPGTEYSVYFQDMQTWMDRCFDWVFACLVHPDAAKHLSESSFEGFGGQGQNNAALLPDSNPIRDRGKLMCESGWAPDLYRKMRDNMQVYQKTKYEAIGPVSIPIALEKLEAKYQRDGAFRLPDGRLLRVGTKAKPGEPTVTEAWISVPGETKCEMTAPVFERPREQKEAKTNNKKRKETSRDRKYKSLVLTSDDPDVDKDPVIAIAREHGINYNRLPVLGLFREPDGFVKKPLPWKKQAEQLQPDAVIVPCAQLIVRFPAGDFATIFKFQIQEAWFVEISAYCESKRLPQADVNRPLMNPHLQKLAQRLKVGAGQFLEPPRQNFALLAPPPDAEEEEEKEDDDAHAADADQASDGGDDDGDRVKRQRTEATVGRVEEVGDTDA